MVLQERYRASERFICRVVGQHRSTQRPPSKVLAIEEAKLRHRLREIAAEHIRWGRRKAHQVLRLEGWLVNRKRAYQLLPEGHRAAPTRSVRWSWAPQVD